MSDLKEKLLAVARPRDSTDSVDVKEEGHFVTFYLPHAEWQKLSLLSAKTSVPKRDIAQDAMLEYLKSF